MQCPITWSDGYLLYTWAAAAVAALGVMRKVYSVPHVLAVSNLQICSYNLTANWVPGRLGLSAYRHSSGWGCGVCDPWGRVGR